MYGTSESQKIYAWMPRAVPLCWGPVVQNTVRLLKHATTMIRYRIPRISKRLIRGVLRILVRDPEVDTSAPSLQALHPPVLASRGRQQRPTRGIVALSLSATLGMDLALGLQANKHYLLWAPEVYSHRRVERIGSLKEP